MAAVYQKRVNLNSIYVTYGIMSWYATCYGNPIIEIVFRYKSFEAVLFTLNDETNK